MEFKNIMVPYDGSEHATRAILAAQYLAKVVEGAKIHVVTVVPAGTLDVGVGEVEEYQAALEKKAAAGKERLVQDLAGVISEGENVSVAAVVSTSPIEGITRYAEKNGIDLIIMGSRGMGGLRGMLGSVSYGVLHAATMPVMTVK